VAGPAGNDALGAAIGLAGGIDEPATVEPNGHRQCHLVDLVGRLEFDHV
jgi:hypothetical protein